MEPKATTSENGSQPSALWKTSPLSSSFAATFCIHTTHYLNSKLVVINACHVHHCSYCHCRWCIDRNIVLRTHTHTNIQLYDDHHS